MMPQSYNPVRLLLRAEGIAGLGLIAYGLWRLGLYAWHDRLWQDFDYDAFSIVNSVLVLVCLVTLVAIGVALSWTAMRMPSRTHLTITVWVTVPMVMAWAGMFIWQEMKVFVVPEAHNLIWHFVFIGFTILTLGIAAWVEWRLAKLSRFVAPDQPWWCPRNIREMCNALAFIMLIMIGGFNTDVGGVVVEPYRREFEGLFLVVLFVACATVAKAGPKLLMSITGVKETVPRHTAGS